MCDIIYPDLFQDQTIQETAAIVAATKNDAATIIAKYDVRSNEHAIRNELQVIVGVAELLKRNITNPYYFEYGKKAEDCDRILAAAHSIVDILTKGD